MNDISGMPLGFLGLICIVVLLVNAVLWLFLPFVLISKLNEMIRRLKCIEAAAETTARNARPGAAQSESAARY